MSRHASHFWRTGLGHLALLPRVKASGPGYGRVPLAISRWRQDRARFLSVLPANDTIYALSSGQSKAGIAVVRISGPASVDVYHGLCPTKPLPRPRYAAVRTLVDPVGTSEVVDSAAVVLNLPGPKTATGEDVVEFHVHGGTATVRAVLHAISRCTSAHVIRYAEPGEFTRRAFLNNRLDLAQVECLGDTLAAETEEQRRAAVRGYTGVVAKSYEAWRSRLLLARGEMEALIDFSEDQHFDESQGELLLNVGRIVQEILASIALHEMGWRRGALLRHGIRIALLGPPNVGKSSLMNQLVGREASIVSAEAGTTRDIIEARLDIRGYLCSFADTAGLRRSEATETIGQEASAIGAIEEEGIRRARKKAAESDVILVLASVEATEAGRFRVEYELETLHLAASAPRYFLVINKCDVVAPQLLASLVEDFKSSVLGHIPSLQAVEPVMLSCKAAAASESATEAGGIPALVDAVAQSFRDLTSLPEDMQHLLAVTERQGQLLVRCRRHLNDFLSEASGREEADTVLAAEHLRLAAQTLTSITGRSEAGDVEEVLGVVFEKSVARPMAHERR